MPMACACAEVHSMTERDFDSEGDPDDLDGDLDGGLDGDLDGEDSVSVGSATRSGVRRVVVSAFALLCVGFAAITRWSAIVASHPAYLLLLVALALAAGAVLSMWATRAWESRRGPRVQRSPQTVVRTLLAATICLAIGGVVLYLRPLPASGSATDLLGDSDAVDVTETLTHLEFAPTAGADTGLVFYPGALVDPRSYAPTLRPLAEAGVLVVVVKMPLGIAFLGSGAANGVIADHPDIDRWAIGGHSLGGAVASSFARATTDDVAGLVFWAAYPTRSMADVTGLEVLSISASNDGLTTRADIADSVDDLPPGAKFVEVAGAVHAFFGDYGEQPGDGVPSIARLDAQSQIVSVTLEWLDSLSG